MGVADSAVSNLGYSLGGTTAPYLQVLKILKREIHFQDVQFVEPLLHLHDCEKKLSFISTVLILYQI